MGPTLEQVRELIVAMLAAPGWIGEGDEIAQDLLAYIDGEDNDADWWLGRKWEENRNSGSEMVESYANFPS